MGRERESEKDKLHSGGCESPLPPLLSSPPPPLSPPPLSYSSFPEKVGVAPHRLSSHLTLRRGPPCLTVPWNLPARNLKLSLSLSLSQTPPHTHIGVLETRTDSLVMDVKVLAVIALLTVALHLPSTAAKPISLVERCWCRSTLSTVPQRSIREIKFLHTPNCPFQVIAKLKNSDREVCINPKTKWLQQYLRNAINKIKKSRKRSN